jgi:hypothetical protein
MIQGQQCYRLDDGPAVFVLPHRVTLPDGTTRTDAMQWFPQHGNSLGWSESTVTDQEFADWKAKEVEDLRALKITQLNQWWDSHPGIEVADGVILPIQEDGRNTNASGLVLGLLMQTPTIDLVSVQDYTVKIPAANAVASLTAFRTQYDAISKRWDDTHRALIAAATMEELNGVQMP